MTVAKIQSRKFGKKEHYGKDWTSLSRAIRSNSNWICSRCFKGFKDNKKELHADHIVPLSSGGGNSISNLQSLCHECHQLKHKRKF